MNWRLNTRPTGSGRGTVDAKFAMRAWLGIKTRVHWPELQEVQWVYRLWLRFETILFCNLSPNRRGLRLLLENLSPEQRVDLKRRGHFKVIGNDTGRRYRILWAGTVHQLDYRGKNVCIWCFYPRGGLVTPDVMLSKKMALETFENIALAYANRIDCRPLI